MNMRAITAATAAAALAAGVAAATAAGSGTAARAPRALVLTVRIDRSSVHQTDVGRKGPSAGDVFVFSAGLRRGGRVVGRLEGQTTAADPRYQGDVKTEYLVLHDGTIAIVGGGESGAPGVGRPDSRIYDAVVGGTGRYNGASGWVSAHDLGPTTQRMTIHLTRLR